MMIKPKTQPSGRHSDRSPDALAKVLATDEFEDLALRKADALGDKNGLTSVDELVILRSSSTSDDVKRGLATVDRHFEAPTDDPLVLAAAPFSDGDCRRVVLPNGQDSIQVPTLGVEDVDVATLSGVTVSVLVETALTRIVSLSSHSHQRVPDHFELSRRVIGSVSILVPARYQVIWKREYNPLEVRLRHAGDEVVLGQGRHFLDGIAGVIEVYTPNGTRCAAKRLRPELSTGSDDPKVHTKILDMPRYENLSIIDEKNHLVHDGNGAVPKLPNNVAGQLRYRFPREADTRKFIDNLIVDSNDAFTRLF